MVASMSQSVLFVRNSLVGREQTESCQRGGGFGAG